MQPIFRIGEAVSYGWGMTKKHFGFLILFILGYFIANVILSMAADGDRSATKTFFELVNIVVNYLGMFIFFRLGLGIYKGEELKVGTIFDIDWRLFGMYFLGSLLVLLSTLAGFVLLVIPGIFIAIRLGFASFSLIDENLDPVDSLKRSWNLTRGHFWNLLGFSIVLALINLFGAMLIGVGLLVTSPICLLATVYVYHKLKGALAVAPADPISPVPVAQ